MPARVQRRDHLLELPHLLAERADRAVRGVRGEVAEGVVAPVVGQAAADQERLGDEVVHRQQLDRGDAEVDQVLDHRRVGQPGVRPAQVLRHRRVQPGEALDVQLVDDRLRHRRRAGDRLGRRGVADHDAQRHGGERVRVVGDVVGLGRVVQDRTGVVHAAGDRAGVRVEQQLGRVEPGAGGRIPLAVHAVAVALLGADSRDVDGPHAVRTPAPCRSWSGSGPRRPGPAPPGSRAAPTGRRWCRRHGCGHRAPTCRPGPAGGRWMSYCGCCPWSVMSVNRLSRLQGRKCAYSA